MSTTFAAQMSTIIGWKITCACGDGAGPMFGSWVEAAAHLRVFVDDESLRTVLPGCQDGAFCLMYRLSATAIESDPSPALNVGNGNATDLFHALGMGTDEDGSSFGSTPVPGSTAVYDVFDGGWMDADEFLGRVLVAMAVAPTDHGRAEQVSFGVGAVMTRCARPAGYLQGRLADLHEIALFAQRLILPMQHLRPQVISRLSLPTNRYPTSSTSVSRPRTRDHGATLCARQLRRGQVIGFPWGLRSTAREEILPPSLALSQQ